MGTVANVKIEPMNVTWGDDAAQVATITCVADVADSLDGKYFFIYTALNAIKYHVWFNTSVGSATDPAPGGSTALVVALTTGATAGAVATAVAAALDGLAGFVATASGAVVTCTNASVGYATKPHEGVGSGFTFDLTTEGDSAVDIGFVEGNIEMKIEEKKKEIMSEQTGENVLSHIRTGVSLDVTLSFQETTIAQMRKLLTKGGSAITPAGAGGTEVVGYGSDKQFTQTILNAQKLVLHPTVLGSGDKTRDFTFWKAYPQLEKLNFSGNDKHVVPVNFMIYPDYSKTAQVRFFAKGDGTQTLT